MGILGPQYLESAHERAGRELPPGHAFRLFFPGWEAGPDRPQLAKNKREGVQRCTALAGEVAKLLDRLLERRRWMAERNDAVLLLEARTTAPLMTGLGMEHPIENGFAFLDPYGVPYLAGSLVKGVVRRAAEELALLMPDDARAGWRLTDVWWLFGLDANAAYLDPGSAERARWWPRYVDWARSLGSEERQELATLLEQVAPDRLRKAFAEDPAASLERELPRAVTEMAVEGSLRLWDVLPKPRNGLDVEILNPHFPRYYQGQGLPTDDQQPAPIYFLAIPAGSSLSFAVELRPSQALPQGLRERWRALARTAFGHACAGVGFGAKTAAGYGAVELEKRAPTRPARTHSAAAEGRRPRSAPRVPARIDPHLLGAIESLLRELEGPDLAEQRVHELYGRLGAYQGDPQKRLAGALKSAFQRRGLWEGAALSRRQIQKVKAIKRILGEET